MTMTYGTASSRSQQHHSRAPSQTGAKNILSNLPKSLVDREKTEKISTSVVHYVYNTNSVERRTCAISASGSFGAGPAAACSATIADMQGPSSGVHGLRAEYVTEGKRQKKKKGI